MQNLLICLVLLPPALAFAIQDAAPLGLGKEGVADTVYYNGDIITVDSEFPSARTVAVRKGKVVALSNRSLLGSPLVGRRTRLVDLRKKTMVPGFVDGHSHFGASAVALNLGFSIAPPPFGNVTSIPQLLMSARDYILRNDVPPGQAVYSMGYSDYQLVEHRHPTRYELDWVSTRHPIVLGHYSGHAVVANSLALELVGYAQEVRDPLGGVLDRYPNGTLTGLCK
jgi:predicted amidohydrolase YtcJ